ncbi:pPIWI_RE module domain-containing protein [Streptomyces sp. NPDC002521]
MKSRPQLQPTSLPFTPDHKRWPTQWWTAALPRPWAEALEPCFKEPNNPYVRIPLGLINSALETLAPGILHFARDADRNTTSWLLAPRTTDRWQDEPRLASAEFIQDIAGIFVRNLRKVTKAEPALRDRVYRAIDSTAPEWTRLDLTQETTNINTAPNGTANPHGLLYRTVPATLIDQLCTTPFTIEDPLNKTSRELRFLPAPTWQGAQAVSWPPLIHPYKGETWHYSLTITITLQTVFEQPHPVVHVHTGVRRWVTSPARVPRGQALGVMIRPGDTWVEGAGAVPGFASAHIAYRGGPAWKGLLPKILDDLSFRTPIPDPQQLLDQPQQWLSGVDYTRAALIHHTALDDSHEIGAGLMPVDRQPLLHWITERLAPYGLPLHTSRTNDLKPRPGTLPTSRKKQTHAERRTRLCHHTGGEVNVHILHTTGSDDPDAPIEDGKIAGPGLIRSVVLEDLGLAEADAQRQPGGAMRWTSSGLTLTLTQAPLGRLAEPLALPENFTKLKKKERDKLLTEATNVRIEQIRQSLPTPPRKAIALVELPNADRYPLGDPKDALRNGLARAGYRSQFFTPVKPFAPAADPKERTKYEKGLRGRTGSSWTDARRHLGDVVIHRPRLAGLPQDVQYVGLWAVTARSGGRSARRYLCPIAVLLDPLKKTAQVSARGVPWCDLGDFPLRLPHVAQPMPSAYDDRIAPVATFLSSLLQDLNTTGRPTLLMTDAHNLRTMAPGFQNAKMVRDKIIIGKAAPRAITLYPGLRHVHVRACGTTHETPQAYAVTPHPTTRNEEGEETPALPQYGLSAGVWPYPGSERVFHSTGSKPGTRSDLANAASVLIHRMVHDQLVIEAHKAAWNPRPLELTVAACQPGDDPNLWAHLTHYLRAVDYYDALLAHPYPLHLAKKLGEYLLPLGGENDEDTVDQE